MTRMEFLSRSGTLVVKRKLTVPVNSSLGFSLKNSSLADTWNERHHRALSEIARVLLTILNACVACIPYLRMTSFFFCGCRDSSSTLVFPPAPSIEMLFCVLCIVLFFFSSLQFTLSAGESVLRIMWGGGSERH